MIIKLIKNEMQSVIFSIIWIVCLVNNIYFDKAYLNLFGFSFTLLLFGLLLWELRDIIKEYQRIKKL